ncbi:LysE/ArgO family amino acid transporter [Aurantimonas sp. Leaf443]|uniref:LysE/ArgO family amino acid transporter n=1 Tax=Aurantimonas sp. Leaf443 TaxID=1736378 RepID=UPI0006FB0B51|nr:LysE/ArgO family amino acid transporter [Aurantimonas sp. Leaf443]KQT88102.1 amino acid transporter [Aurantimonas sp. Leaf443]
MTDAALSGFLLGLGLIVAIGAQNAFVLRQGLAGRHVFAVCLTCAVCDAVLIAFGVAGLGVATAALPALEPVLRYGGAAFLVAYALRSARAAWRGGASLAATGATPPSLRATLLSCLAFTLLNPHVYLDTVLLVGSVARQYPGRETAFALGAMAASFAFFFSLGYGARFLRPLFGRPAAWRVLDGAIALVMAAIALRLLTGG